MTETTFFQTIKAVVSSLVTPNQENFAGKKSLLIQGGCSPLTSFIMNLRVDSPKTREACLELGIDPEEMKPKSFK